jgi:16S rRNA G966 N2-methylase RsmD
LPALLKSLNQVVSDTYDVGSFDHDIVVNKAAQPKCIYDMHMYWSKKHWGAIREYIRHYLPKKLYPHGEGVVVDPYCGSGMTGVAALMEDKTCILVDASPAAAFISHHYVHPLDPTAFEAAYERMLSEEYDRSLQLELQKIAGRAIPNLQAELDWLYETKCDRCGGAAVTEYVVYSQAFHCPNCPEVVALYDCPVVPVDYQRSSGLRGGSTTEVKRKPVCPHCYKKHGNKGRQEYVISTRSKRFGERPVRIAYTCRNGCSPARDYRDLDDPDPKKARYFKQRDLTKIETLSHANIPHPYPARSMMDVTHPTKPWGMEWRPGRDFRTVEELYVRRNFWALAAIADRANRSGETRGHLMMVLTSFSLNASRMYRYRPSGKGGFKAGSYYIPQLSQNMSVRSQLADKYPDFLSAQAVLCEHELHSPRMVTNDSNSVLWTFPECSVDYVFTDPPYAEKVQYGELNFIWESWLGYNGEWRREETVVKSPGFDPEGLYTADRWESRIRDTFRACYRALKPGRWASICYHDTAEGTWRRVQDALLDIGFEIGSVTVLDPLQKSANQITAEKVVKSDLVINCRKPREGELALSGESAEATQPIRERVRNILEETLSISPGLTRDKLFDVVARRLVERAQFVEHRFEDILHEIATVAEGDRWYLKAELEQLSQHDLANEERAGDAIVRFARLRRQGAPAKYAALVALEQADLCVPNSRGDLDESTVEEWINAHLFKEDRELLLRKNKKKLELGGRLAGIEFYDALFFYFTKYMRGKKANQLPRRNLAEFLAEYLIRFSDGEKWLYRPPEGREETDLRTARRSGLGRRIRAFVNALRESDRLFIESHRPDVRTFVEWLRYCAAVGYFEEGAVLFEDAGFTVDQLQSVTINEVEEETAYDAARGFADICRRRIAAPKTEIGESAELELEDEEE